MSEKKEGVLKRVVRDFGFIKLVGGPELFVHKSDYPGQMTEGSRVRCEESDPDPAKDNKTHAMNIEVLDRVPPRAPAPAGAAAVVLAAPAPVAQAAIATDELEVEIVIGDPYTWFETIRNPIEELVDEVIGASPPKPKKEKRFGLTVNVIVTRRGRPVPNMEVKLDADSRPVSPSIDGKVYTGKDGKSPFRVILPLDATTCYVLALVNGKSYGHLWQKDPPAPTQKTIVAPEPPAVGILVPPAPLAAATSILQTPAPGPSSIVVEKSGPDANGVYVFHVTAIPNKNVVVGGNVAVETRLVGQVTWSQGPFTADDQGQTTIEVKVRDQGEKGEIDFRCESLVSKSRYVTSKK